MRGFETRCFPKQVNDDKRFRTFMTTSGMKTFRMQPSIDNSVLAKYQARSERPPLAHSTPEPPCTSGTQTGIRSRTTSCKERKSVLPKSFESSSKMSTIGSRSASPASRSYSRPSGSFHTRAFTVRSASCTPPHMYMQPEDLRNVAKLSRPSSQSSARHAVLVSKPEKQEIEELPDRFGKPITLPKFVKTNPHLKHSKLSMGQRQYLWGIAQIYSVGQLKTLKQRQYQTLLDHEFKRRLEKLGLKEREKVKEMKDYLRYTKFINTYEQRIPQHLVSRDSPGEVRVADHIYRHAIKGWTTDIDAASKYREENYNDKTQGGGVEKVESQEKYDVKTERGAHIYKHVIKGWTMDPAANDVFQMKDISDSEEEKEHEMSLAELENALEEGVSVYRVDITRSKNKSYYDQGADVMKITRINPAVDDNFI